MTSLGNVEATPYASLTFISFTRGDILYLTGNARNLFGSEARAIMPLQDTLTEVFITGYTLVKNALPARQLREEIQGSPYSPPIKLLAEEATQANMFSTEEQPTALLTRIMVHSPTIATFEWESSAALRVVPGQAALLDFRPLFGSRQYQHMSPSHPKLVNDDFIRTWTISSAEAAGAETKRFRLTIREKPGGIITGALFKMVRKLLQQKPEMLENTTPLSFIVNIAGVSGDFVLPTLPKLDVGHGKDVRHLFWFAGGIGVTPFLSMMSALAQSNSTSSFDITLAISTHEPDVTISLLESAIGSVKSWPNLSIHMFTNAPPVSSCESSIALTRHQGRIQSSFFDDKKDLLEKGDTRFYLCGPEAFERSILDMLAKFNVNLGCVHREGFAY
jgi:NAD(P)H-flavin reductase